jgi:dihydrofolate synthase/folylpolyglutamate synthase
MMKALSKLQSPHLHLRAIHVAGTNGKGSTCTKIAKAFEVDGFRVGLYTSPHIDSYTERIQINSTLISEPDFLRHLLHVYKECGEDFSFFEIMTLIAFLYFRENSVDIAVMETGIGGRKDATNLCHPVLSIITSISLDHTELLGDTIEAIAREKAGIIKPGVQVVIGPHVPFHIIQEYAQFFKAPLCRVQGDFSDFDDENSQIALKALSFFPVSEESVRAAISVRPMCRFERISNIYPFHLKNWILDGAKTNSSSGMGIAPVEVILDVAHNPEGISRLMRQVSKVFSGCRCVVLLGVCKDKLYENMLKMLPEGVILICTQASSERALSAIALSEAAKKVGTYEIYVEKELEKAVSQALGIASRLQVPLIVTGTFYMMGTVKRFLGTT